MGPCSLRRRFPALALAGCLVLLPAAARALPVGSGSEGPVAVRESGGWLDWLGRTFLSLWAGDNGTMTLLGENRSRLSAGPGSGLTVRVD
jgi:hypothetical protein